MEKCELWIAGGRESQRGSHTYIFGCMAFSLERISEWTFFKLLVGPTVLLIITTCGWLCLSAFVALVGNVVAVVVDF
jgi:hypothetical protein